MPYLKYLMIQISAMARVLPIRKRERFSLQR